MAGTDASNTGTPYPIWGFGPPSSEPDTKKLDALLASLNGSAERFQTLWFSFLGLTLYLAIAALATTHRNLLLGEPQTLPILNIKVELLPFYVIAPLLYLVFHFYLLMMLALLARTAAEFDKQLRTTLPRKPEQERFRALVGNALFLQLLVGMKGERTGVNALLMGLIALITIVLAPLATLVLMQMMFLPYHHFRITWWHRGMVVVDLVLIVVMTYRCFFPRGVRKAPLVLGALARKPRWATAMAFCVLLAVALAPLSYWLSFQQGRWAGEPRTSSWREWAQWMEGKPPPASEVKLDYAATEKGVVFGLFPDRLKLRNEPIVGGTRFEETKKEMASGRDFVPTRILDGRDLQAADLFSADLRGVGLNDADLRGAELGWVRLEGARLSNADLRGATLNNAKLQNAFLFMSRLQAAQLGGAQLQGATLLGARFQGADLFVAQLQGVVLQTVELQGASLIQAGLQGASFGNARLQGANLMGAELQGAHLGEAQLQGATLLGAQLQGANFGQAQLDGANLRGAQLQGADLSRADLTGTTFDETFVFRTNAAAAGLATTTIRSLDAEEVKAGEEFGSPPKPLTPADVESWIAAATQVAQEEYKTVIAARFARLQPNFREDVREVTWQGMKEASVAIDPDGARHRRGLATILADLACKSDGPYVARALANSSGWKSIGPIAIPHENSRLAALGDQLERVRTRMKAGRDKPDACKGVSGFTEEDWRKLDAIKPE